MLRVLAIDPGVTTGLCYGEVTQATVKLSAVQAKLDVVGLTDYLSDLQPDVVVCESFRFRNRARDGLNLYSRNLIGVIELYVAQSGADLVMQSPAEAKTYFTASRLRTDGLWIPREEHSRDALRHFMYWFTFGPGFQLNCEQPVIVEAIS